MQGKHILINILIAIAGMLLIIYSFSEDFDKGSIEKTEKDSLITPNKVTPINSNLVKKNL